MNYTVFQWYHHKTNLSKNLVQWITSTFRLGQALFTILSPSVEGYWLLKAYSLKFVLWFLTAKSRIFQSCQDEATTTWVITSTL